jgi:TolB-like protein
MNESPRQIGLWEELKRRKVVRVATVYAVVGWLIIQVADTTFENFGIPAWAFRFIVIVLLLGFPLSLVLAWALELTPGGLRRTTDTPVAANDAVPAPEVTAGGNRVPAIVAAVVATVFLGALTFVFYLKQEDEPAPVVDAAPQERTIAVLPLVNMSMMPENAYFAGGIHEDILTNLSRVEGFQVVSRTSVMPYLESSKSLREIGAELGADLILEGSVRRIDDHVRVTVQLIETANDRHLWANNYDREVRDEFATQSALAREISRTVRREVLPEAEGALDGLPTSSVKAYDLYNQAMNIMRTEVESESTLTHQRALLEEAVAEDPDFVEAWALLNEVLDHSIRTLNQNGWFLRQGQDRAEVFDALRAASKTALDQAVALDPDNKMTLFALASDSVEEARAEFRAERKKVIDRIVEEYPDDALGWYVLGWWYFLEGDTAAAVEPFNKAISLEPFHAQIVDGTLTFARTTGDQELVTRLFERIAQISPERAAEQGLANAVDRIRIWNLVQAFYDTANMQLLDNLEEVLFSESTNFLSRADEAYYKSSYYIYRNQFDELLALQEVLVMPEKPDAWDVMFFNAVSIDLAVVLLEREQTESARFFARQTLSTQNMPQVSHPELIDRNHSSFAVACFILGDTECTQRWTDKLLDERDDSYNAFGLAGMLALGLTDPEEAARLVLAEKRKFPRWRGTDIIAAYHRFNAHLILQPELAAFYRDENKWSAYLEERLPGFAADS